MDATTCFGTRQGSDGTEETQGQNNGRETRRVGQSQESEKVKRLKKIAQKGVMVLDMEDFDLMQNQFHQAKESGSILYNGWEYVFWVGIYRGKFKSDLEYPEELEGEMNVESK